METKKIVRKLELINDINQLSEAELANKYLSSKENYSKFLDEYSYIFSTSPLYQLRAFQNYNKILSLVNYGNMMYQTEKNGQIELELLSNINYNVNEYRLNIYRDDEQQSKYLLNENIGATKIKGNISYEDLVKGMYNASLKYAAKNDKSVNDFDEYLIFIKYAYNFEGQKKLLDRYIEEHNLLNSCNDIYFLFYANYIIKKYPNEVDDEFLIDVKNVINISDQIEEAGLNSSSEKYKEYNKVANYTLKNIKNFKKEQEKKLIKM